MKVSSAILAAVLASSVVFTAGCTTLKNNRLTKNFSLVKEGMTEAQVEALLGFPEWGLPPLNRPSPFMPGTAVWTVSEGPDFDANTVSVHVTFDRNRRVATKRISTSLRTDPNRKNQVRWAPEGLPSTTWDRGPPRGGD